MYWRILDKQAPHIASVKGQVRQNKVKGYADMTCYSNINIFNTYTCPKQVRQALARFRHLGGHHRKKHQYFFFFSVRKYQEQKLFECSS